MKTRRIDYKRAYMFQWIHIFFMFLFTIGITCNFLAVVHNGGRMPVYNFYADDTEHFGYENSSEVNHPLLSDRFNIIPNQICSIGDLLMIFSVAGMFITVIVNGFTKYGAFKR